MNAMTKSIVVDLRELGALRRTRVPATDPADEYLSKLIPARAMPAPRIDFVAGAPMGPDRRNRLH